MSETVRKQKPKAEKPVDEVTETEVKAPAHQELKDELDDLLDEIDEVLEENAAEFVAAYQQKGGE